MSTTYLLFFSLSRVIRKLYVHDVWMINSGSTSRFQVPNYRSIRTCKAGDSPYIQPNLVYSIWTVSPVNKRFVIDLFPPLHMFISHSSDVIGRQASLLSKNFPHHLRCEISRRSNPTFASFPAVPLIHQARAGLFREDRTGQSCIRAGGERDINI